MQTIVLSYQDVAALLPYATVNGMVDTVFKEWGNGNVVMPPKINLDMSRSGYDSWNNAMPAFQSSEPVISGWQCQIYESDRLKGQ